VYTVGAKTAENMDNNKDSSTPQGRSCTHLDQESGYRNTEDKFPRGENFKEPRDSSNFNLEGE
jgi:hypothetical protein